MGHSLRSKTSGSISPRRELDLEGSPPAAGNDSGGSFFRQGVEFFVLLGIAVAMFKSFAAEGYQIETASMAPTLLGHHRDVVCPGCHCGFPVNLTPGERPGEATCPNCTLPSIRTDQLLRQDGDQLLVNRMAYEFREPARWEVVVFRNPRNRKEAYVKRLVGLPGESLQLQRGDLVINGEVQRKPYGIQKAVRILIHDQELPVDRSGFTWESRWRADGAWREEDRGFRLDDKHSEHPEHPWSILRYSHWIRSGGNYLTSEHLEKLPEGVPLSPGNSYGVEFHPERKELSCRGVMSESEFSRLSGLSPDADYQSSLRNLHEASHLSPVGDACSYNSPAGGTGTYFVPDLMLSCEVDYRGGGGGLRLVIDSGRGEYVAEFDFGEKTVSILKTGDPRAMRRQSFPRATFQRAARIDFSVFDRQALLTIDDQEALEPVPFPDESPHISLPRSPVRFEARNAAVRVSKIRLFRDVYYTPADPSNKDQKFELRNSGENREYFFLGDNSPVSVDSRFWDRREMLRRSDFLGQPFLVHLPGKTRTWRIGKWQTNIRIPDFSRIRYIR